MAKLRAHCQIQYDIGIKIELARAIAIEILERVTKISVDYARTFSGIFL